MELSSVQLSLIGRIKRKLIFHFRLIKLFSNWPVYYLDLLHLLKNKTLVYRARRGIKFKIRTNKEDFKIVNAILTAKVYHKLLKYIKDNSIVVDIGAHIGIFSVFAAKLASNVKVFCYEPSEDNYTLLKDNIAINNLKRQVVPTKEGVCGKKGKRSLFIDNSNPAWHSMFDKLSNKKTDIKCTTLKDILDKNKIRKCDFLKINCEGAEYEILFNTPKKYFKKIGSITIEFHPTEDIRKLKKFLENNGFSVIIERPKLVKYNLLYAERGK